MVKTTSVRTVDSLVSRGTKGEHSVGGGLYLSVNGVGAASWIFRFQLDGKRKRIGLGGYPSISLSAARVLAAEQKALLAQGVNPQQQKAEQVQQKRIAGVTFDEVTADYIEVKRSEWRREKQANDWRNSLKTYASPIIGKLPPMEITTEHVMGVLEPIWITKHVTARKLRSRIELVLDYAKARRLRTGENPATWRANLEPLLPKSVGQVQHMPALPYDQMPAFWQVLRRKDSVAAACLMFTILTCLRAGETRHAQWGEFNWDESLWIVPASRMKRGVEHRVPLSAPVIELLHSLPRTDSPFVFISRNGGAITDMSMTMLLRRLDKARLNREGKGWRDRDGRIVVTHGFRSTFRDWAAEQSDAPNIVAEQVLHHAIGNKVEAVYRRGDLLEKRRELMTQWAVFVTGQQDD